MSKSSTNTTISSTADPTGRTPQDYALEFAEYLAQGAEQFIAAVNADAEVRLRIAERDDVDDDTERDVRSDVSEMMRELRRNIYEFRKRRDRAMRAQAAPAEPIVRLNGYQLRDALAFIAPDGTGDQLATEACIQRGPARTDGEDSDPAGMFCWYSDYPEEGSMRLGEGPEDCFATAPTTQPAPIDMVLHCPVCGMQHVDADEWVDDPHDIEQGRILAWKNEPHRSHLCHGCRHIWRPADVPTNGVRAVKTKGEADSPLATPQPAARQEVDGEIALALSALEENHQWHQDYDDHDGYPGSPLEESNVRAISALKSIAAAHPQAKKGGT